MKAAVLVEPGRIEIREVADPEPGPGEVLISVEGVGICGSDHSVFSGKWAAPEYPWIMGHEAFGVIEAVGEGAPTPASARGSSSSPTWPASSASSAGWGEPRRAPAANRSG